MTEIRLAAGDVLLVMGSQDNVQALRESKDALLMEWSTEEIPSKIYARRVNLIFGAVVGVSALGIIPIYLAAFMGALAAIFAVIFATNCCSLASPIGYQTNLLVMAPGHYKFMDYIKAGLPLVLLIWAAYTAYAYFVF
jgi:di/tricarboxylate transporter